MENTNATEVICLIDKSGSMETLRQETIDGLNTFIEEQQHDSSTCNFTLVQFNQQVSVSLLRQPMQSMRKLTLQDYKPWGYTALYDALGMTLNQSIKSLYMLPELEKPSKVLVTIITDGLENASRTYTKRAIQKLIQTLTEVNGWEFQFFGANIDAFAEAENIGLKRDKAESWNFDKGGIEAMIKSMSQKSSDFRKRGF
jgi:uncharacterized protein YegL